MAAIAQIQVSCGSETISFRSDIGIQYSDNVSFSLIARGCQNLGINDECKVFPCRYQARRWRDQVSGLSDKPGKVAQLFTAVATSR